MEQVLTIDEIDKQELAKVIVELIRKDPQIRGAIMRCAYNTPGIMVEY